MNVQRQNNELLVRLKIGADTGRIQAMLDYLRYEELTADSNATQEDVNQLVNEIKKGRWQRIRKEIGIND
jgi:hypothetical protein